MNRNFDFHELFLSFFFTGGHILAQAYRDVKTNGGGSGLENDSKSGPSHRAAFTERCYIIIHKGANIAIGRTRRVRCGVRS